MTSAQHQKRYDDFIIELTLLCNKHGVLIGVNENDMVTVSDLPKEFGTDSIRIHFENHLGE